MRLTCLAPLLALLAQFAPAQTLTDAEILERMDDATASEARWILDSGLLATGAVGIAGHDTRAGIAYERILRSKDSKAFHDLTFATNDVSVCYGIAGLGQLAPQDLPALLPRLILRTASVAQASGCISSHTSVCSEFADEVKRRGVKVDRVQVEAAWSAWLGALVEREASEQDGEAVACVLSLIGELPDEETGTSPYAMALADDDGRETALRALAREAPASTSGRLALQRMAAGRKPWAKTDLLEAVWTRSITTADAVLDLRIEAEFWDRVIRGLNDPGDDGLSVFYDCKWHSLTDEDWEWLAARNDAAVAEAAGRLQSNVIASWRIDAAIPEDPVQRRHAIFCLLATAAREDTAARRARHRLKVVALDANYPLPACENWRSDRSADAELARITLCDGPKPMLPMLPILSVDWDQHANGLRLLLATLTEDEQAGGELAARHDLLALIKRLWKECDDGPDDQRWWLRLTTMKLLEEVWTTVREEFPDRDKVWQGWLSALARGLVKNPRSMPPRLDASMLRDLILQTEGRAGDLVEAVFSGDDEFLPDDETPKRRPEEEREPTAEIIYNRMKEAAAKLE